MYISRVVLLSMWFVFALTFQDLDLHVFPGVLSYKKTHFEQAVCF